MMIDFLEGSIIRMVSPVAKPFQKKHQERFPPDFFGRRLWPLMGGGCSTIKPTSLSAA